MPLSMAANPCRSAVPGPLCRAESSVLVLVLRALLSLPEVTGKSYGTPLRQRPPGSCAGPEVVIHPRAESFQLPDAWSVQLVSTARVAHPLLLTLGVPLQSVELGTLSATPGDRAGLPLSGKVGNSMKLLENI